MRAVKRRVSGKGSPQYIDELACRLVEEGNKGNVVAINAIGDRLDGKPAQAIAIKGDPDSPVIFNLRLGDGIVPKVIDGEVVSQEAVAAPLVAMAAQDEEG